MLYKNIIASSKPLVVSVPTCSMEEGTWSGRSEWAPFSAHRLKVPSRLEGSRDLWPGSGRLGNSCSAFGHCEISVTQTDSSYVKRATVSSFKDTSRRRKGAFFPYFFSYFISKLQLLADQNLKFIDPFCKIVAKTKE